jgi:hypothetical protein
MATADDYAAWIVKNADKKGTPEFETVAQAYRASKGGARSQPETYDPTEGMSGLDKFRAGMGKAIYDTGRGLKGLIPGMVSDEEVDAQKKMDAPLMNTGAGMAGNVTGEIGMMLAPGGIVHGIGKAAKIPQLINAGRAMLAPTSIPGAATQGAAFGAIQPVGSDGSRLVNMALGSAGAAAIPVASAGVTLGRAAMAPFTAGGREKIAGQALERFATDPNKIAQASSTSQIPGSVPTLAEVTDDVGLSQLQRTLLNNPDSAAPITERLRANNAARTSALQDIAGDASKREFFAADRAAATQPLYDQAFSQQMHDTPWIKGQITQLQKRPAFQKAMNDAVDLAQNMGVKIDPENATQVAHYAKMALDDQIDVAMRAGSKNQVRALVDTKQKLVSLMESGRFAPGYKDARETYAAMSKPINQMEVGQRLLDTMRPALADFGADTRVNAASYAKALRDGDQTARKATGFSGAKLENIMDPQQMATLQAIGKELGNSARAQELGMAKGSPTTQGLVSQDILRQVLGPTGLPQSWAEAVLPQTLMRPAQFAYKPAEERVLNLLGQAALDPQMAKELLKKGRKTTAMDRLLQERLPFLSPVGGGGLLGLSQ